jgi:hypothetical protein
MFKKNKRYHNSCAILGLFKRALLAIYANVKFMHSLTSKSTCNWIKSKIGINYKPMLASYLSFDQVIKLVMNNLPMGFWFFNHMVLNFQNLITYLDDLIIILMIWASRDPSSQLALINWTHLHLKRNEPCPAPFKVLKEATGLETDSHFWGTNFTDLSSSRSSVIVHAKSWTTCLHCASVDLFTHHPFRSYVSKAIQICIVMI